MTKDQYLDELKSKLTYLTDEQIKETIQYYSDYFDDAKNDEKLIKELGSTDELAELIKNKYQKKMKKTEDKNVTEEYIDEKALYYSYEPGNVKNLSLVLGAANVVMISGNKYSVETRGVEEECLITGLSKDGTLSIYNNKRVNYNFWNHERNYRAVPRILITVPENAKVNTLKISIGAGRFRTNKTEITCEKGILEVGAGELQTGKINGGSVDIRCGMGKLDLSGVIEGFSKIDCGMGAVDLNLSGNEKEYSYEAKVGLGEFTLNNHKKNGVGQESSPEKKCNHFSINCGIGRVSIKLS